MHNRYTTTLQNCQSCNSLNNEEFKQVVKLKKSRLLIYIHNKKSLQKMNFEDRGSIILYNTGHKDIKRFDYIAELCQYKTRCFKCKALIQHIRCLIDNVSTINKNEILGICEYCKRLPQINKCKKCEYLMHKFLNNETKRNLENKIRFNELLCKVRQILLSVTEEQTIFKHNIYLDSESKINLDALLKRLYCPATATQPDIDFLLPFLDKEKLGSIIFNNNEKLSPDLITKTDSVNRKDSILENELSLSISRSNCFCKYLLNDKIMKSAPFGKFLTMEDSGTLLETKRDFDIKLKSSSEKLIPKLPKLITISNTMPTTPNAPAKLKQITRTKALSKDKCIKYNVSIKNKMDNLKIQKGKGRKLFPESENELIIKMVKQRKKVKDETKKFSQPKKIEESSKILYLPIIENIKEKKEILLEKSESIAECEGEQSFNISEMIKGTKIVPYNHHHTYHNMKKLPILFQTQQDDFKLPALDTNKTFSAKPDSMKRNIRETIRENSKVNNSGIVLYQLSNREFIDKGWTILPTTKIMRKMNIYKMIPSDYKFNWFNNHKDQKILFYDSSEKLAEIYENGCGKWFYKNGNVALDYYSAAELCLGKRCIIFRSDDHTGLKKKKVVNILACFDYLGNGVVYDNDGNIRLKFNQSEGLVIDKKIGPPGRWKWHALNEPLVQYPVFFNTYVKNEQHRKEFKNWESIIKQNDKMVDIELDKFRKEKAVKILQEYKSFQIRIKVVKINDYFTLRIINQAKMYLHFRCERIRFKLNVGMLLKNEEILDTGIAEISEVSTPYD